MRQQLTWNVALVASVVLASLTFSVLAPNSREPASSPPAPPLEPVSADPYIVSTSPADSATNVSVDASVIVTFSEPMGTSSVYWNFTPAAILVPTWTGGDTVLALMSAAGSPLPPFARCAVYTATITGRDPDGNPLVPGPVPNPWSFRTACPGPVIAATSPADGETGTPTNTSIVVTFSEPMDTATVTWSLDPDFVLTPSWNSPADTVLVLASQVAPFDACTRYTVQVDGQDKGGNPLLPGPVPNPWDFTTACTGTPRGLRATALPPSSVLLTWQPVSGADSYRVYTSPDRFAAFPSGWNLLSTVATSEYVAAGHLSDGTTHYYVVRAAERSHEGPNSTMGAKTVLRFDHSTAGANIAWFSLPYDSGYARASDVTNALGSNIDVVGTWDAKKQRSTLFYWFRGSWRGKDFPIEAGDGLYLGIRASFTWVVVGTDRSVDLTFAPSPDHKASVNWIGLPYTGAYASASDLSAALGPGKVVEVGLWDVTTQSVTRWYWNGPTWTGTDFAIAPGAGVYLVVVSSFTWAPLLATPPQPE